MQLEYGLYSRVRAGPIVCCRPLRLTIAGRMLIPVTTAAFGAMKGDPAQQLLTIVVNWYQSLAHPSTIDDQRLLVNLDRGNSQDTLALAREFIASPFPNNHVIGLTAAIRLGSDSAIATLARELPTLRAHPKFGRITEALHTYYQPHGILPSARFSNLFHCILTHPTSTPRLELHYRRSEQRLCCLSWPSYLIAGILRPNYALHGSLDTLRFSPMPTATSATR